MNTPVGTNCIETVSGLYIDLLDPKVEQIDHRDMGWALSRMPRYAGHTMTTLPYTVGQHSTAVAKIVQRLKDPKETGLRQSFYNETHFHGEVAHYITGTVLLHSHVHDGSEAYLLDLPTPLKQLPGMKEAYGAIEQRMMETIWQSLGLSEPDSTTRDIIKWADMYALTIEAYHLMPSRGTNWTRLLNIGIVELQDFEPPKPAIEVYREFMAWLDELQYERNRA
jgi:5'-deoxynucleotidase YfbR-like HD superfamily hydrolase